jgi:hypothetical protein
VKKSVEERRSEILDVTCDVVVERGSAVPASPTSPTGSACRPG